MDKDEKILIAIGAVLLISILYFSFFVMDFTGSVIFNKPTVFNTETICNETNFCQDFDVYCKGSKFIEMNLIEGTDFQHDESWVDSRTEEEKKLC